MDNNALFDLSKKVAIVTGAAHGIGKASCEMLAKSGASVVVSDYDLSAAQDTAKALVANGHKAIAIKCDVTKDEELVALVEQTIKEFGTINILLNNVGGGTAGAESPYEIDVAEFKRVFEMNVFSMWRLCQLAAPHMRDSGYGSIINMSSMASINKSPAVSAYAASKAAINHMSCNLAYDFGPEIRVNTIGPGAVRTDALKKVLTPEIEKRMLAHTPLERLGEAEDIAGAVLYFASPISKWVSGQVLFVNGGGVQTLD